MQIVRDPLTKCIIKCKIIDFGFAIYIDTLKDKSPKERFVGTPNYIAPEILNHKSSYDAKIDMFSVGVIVYFMYVTVKAGYRATFLSTVSTLNSSTKTPSRAGIPCQAHVGSPFRRMEKTSSGGCWWSTPEIGCR